MLVALEMDAVRQAVRLDNERVDTSHLLLATIELDRDVAATGLKLPESCASVCRAGEVLAEFGVGYAAAVCATGRSDRTAATVSAIPGPWWWHSGRRRWWRTNARTPPWLLSAAVAADHAWSDGVGRGTRVGSSHLLIAALANREGPASHLLHRLGDEPEAVVDATIRRLQE